jgi:hypothetical protein
VSSLTIAPAVHRRFERLCALLAKRGRGRTLTDLGDAWTLAQALDEPGAHPGTVAELVVRLDLVGSDLEPAA